MLRKPPDVLITTPESLYLMLTSRARESLAETDSVIVDEIHAVAPTKRGAHLALTLERLERVAGRPLQRIGLSATQRPLEEVARFLGGSGRECRIVDAGVRKPLDLKIHVPVESMSEPDVHDVGNPADRRLGTAAGGGDLVGTGMGEQPATSRSIWPAIYPELLDLIGSTARRSSSRTAAAGPSGSRCVSTIWRASRTAGRAGVHRPGAPRLLAREERVDIEDLLKSGELPCLVATSSLELGIDMGAVDLVIQVESPKSVTAGLQRIGRAGHGVGEVSHGRIFPKFRADLLECAVVAKRMRDGDIEPTVVPRNPLDVLAQQVVAMTATGDEWRVPELHETVRRAYPFAELSRELLDSVLDMLDGRYPSEEFAELRPRIVWDRVEDTIRARRGALQLAVTNGGTIPDRGLYGVHLPDGRRVGELDEEMVYEARPGQTFLLGASTWRIEEITRDRVIVTPAPGAPGAVPFWRGEARPAVGARGRDRRVLARGRRAGAGRAGRELRPRRARRHQPVRLPARAARGHARRADRPHDRRRALPRRARRLAPLRALAVRRPRPRGLGARPVGAPPRRFGLESDASGPTTGSCPPGRLGRAAVRRPDHGRAGCARGAGGRELSSSALFGARFRENAARALLLPRARPGKRTPLWLQRLRAQSLLEVARRYGHSRSCSRHTASACATSSTCRGSSSCCAGCAPASSRSSRSRPSAPPPSRRRCSSPSSPPTCTRATRRTPSGGPRRSRSTATCCASSSARRTCASSSTPPRWRRSRTSCSGRATGRAPPTPRPCTISCAGSATCPRTMLSARPRGGLLAPAPRRLEASRRAVRVRIGGEDRWIAAEDAGLYRDALGGCRPVGFPPPSSRPRRAARAARPPLRAHPRPVHDARALGPLGLVLGPALRELERAAS